MKMLEEIRFDYRRLAVFGIVLSVAILPLCLCATELPERDWERIDLDGDHTSIEAADKSRRNSAIPPDTAGDLIVPSALRGYRVVSVGNQAFYNCTNLTSVTIPEGVTNIADQAFYSCSSLTNVVFPSTLKSIGASAFIGCQKLQKVDIKVPRLTIGDGAFRDCDGLLNLRFEGDELFAGTRAFFGCGGLRDVNLVVKDVVLPERVFSDCNQLTNVFVAASNRVEFGVSVFAGSALQQVTLTAGAEMNVGATAFSGCTALHWAELTAGAGMSVGTSAFSGCNHLTNVHVVASNRVELGSSVFSGCSALQRAELTAGMGMSVGASAFYNCTKLQKVSVVAPEATTFGDSVFSSCPGLQAVELPAGLVSVPTNAFSHCSALQAVSLSSNVTSIAYRAFDTCTSLKTVELPEGLRTIGAQAFYGCEDLAGLKIPQSVDSLGDRAFEACDGLGEVVFSGIDTNLYAAAEIDIGERCFYQDITLSNVVFSAPSRIKAFGARTFSGCESLVRISLPTDLVEIAESLFESCTALVDVPLPVTLTAIGNTAFNGCASLKDFQIPTNNVVTIGNKAFANTKFWNEWPNDSLVVNNGYILGFKGNPASVILPENCKAIPNGMFEGMTALTNVVIPAGLESVGSWAFAGSGLQWIDFSRSKVTTIGVSAFEGCSNLVSCLLSDSLTAIPDGAFRNCASLSAVDIPDSIMSIGNSAFRDCSALSVVSGGAGVRTVGDYAFAGCVNLLPFRFSQDVAYGEHVFQGVRWTENVIFPSVGTMAQEYPNSYASVKSIVFSSTLTGLVERACAGCAALESIAIPDGVRSIGARAFEGCSSLTSLVMPASVINVGSNAFNGCTAVISLTTSGQIPTREMLPECYGKLGNIRIAFGAESLCDEAFAGCTAMTGLDIPSSVMDIGARAFSGCTGLGTLTLPGGLESIGEHAFANCTGLTQVNYFGPCPNGASTVYVGTSVKLVSRVLKENAASWGVGEGVTWWPKVSVERGETAVGNGARRVILWAPSAEELRSAGMITFYYYDRTGRKDVKSIEEGLEMEPEYGGYSGEDYSFDGWWTKPYGGVRMESAEDCESAGVTAVYAHWVQNRADHDDPQAWDDVLYDVNKTHVYDGYLLDGGAVAGTITLSLAKGKYDRAEETTSVKMTAKVLLLGEGMTLSLKGEAEDVGEDGGSGTLAKGEREADIEFGPQEMSGSFEGYDIVGARNVFGAKTDWDRRAALAAVDDCEDVRLIVLQADGDSPFANGYVAMSVTLSSKGKAKVSGTLPDGTKVNVSSQLLVFGDRYVLPVVAPLYSGKRGGFGFSIGYPKEENEDSGGLAPYVAELSDWVANTGKGDEFVASLEEVGVGAAGNISDMASFGVTDSFDVEGVDIDDLLLPESVEIAVSGSKWKLPKADKVVFDRDAEAYEVVTDYGNPAGLKLSYVAKTGMFKGSFNVYAVTDAGKSKKYTATVNGAVLDGIGYGTAVIKKVGSVPAVITVE